MTNFSLSDDHKSATGTHLEVFNGELVLPNGIVSIGKYALSLEHVTKVVLPDSVTKIQSGAFRKCTKLREVTFSKNLKIIEDEAFYGCTALKKIVLPNSLKHIGESCFENCSNLKTIDFADCSAEICIYAFFNCCSLQEISIPAGITKIDAPTFGRCFSVQNVQVDCRNSAFFAKDGCVIEKNDGVLIFGNSKCKLPEGVKILGGGAYTNYPFEEIFLPSTVEKIAFYAFDECESLKTVHFNGTLEQWHAINFEEDEYWSLQAYGEHEYNGVPYWYFTRCKATVICTDGEEELCL